MHVFTYSALMDHSSVSNVMPIGFQNFPLHSRLHCNMLYIRPCPPLILGDNFKNLAFFQFIGVFNFFGNVFSEAVMN